MRIEDYGFIGDTYSGALVSRDGSIDWLCLPRFDSPSSFARILDSERGGHWSLCPAQEVDVRSRRYRGDSLVLETSFETSTGRATVVDCLPVESALEADGERVVAPDAVIARLVRGEGGSVPMKMEYRPRFDYGSIVLWFRRRGDAIEAVGGPDALDLVATVPLELSKEGSTAPFDVRSGAEAAFLASYHESHAPRKQLDPLSCAALIDATQRHWVEWAASSTDEGPWRDAIIRSLLVLKALTFAPSGGLVAAPTTSLPEQLGGERNWDYRYCWLRDATFTLDVLLEQGFTAEAEAWRDWLLRAVAGDPDDLQIMYGLSGERRLPEQTIPWLNGFAGSRPVRIGNAAHAQFQLDVYGEVLDSLYSARRAGIPPSGDAWDLQRELIESVCERWGDPDEGIWEVRSGPRHFVHSKVMAWVALDRAIKQSQEFSLRGDTAEWRAVRDRIKAEVLDRGVVSGRFRRSYEEDGSDAALLTLPLLGFLDADDPVMRSTIKEIQRDLMEDGFVRRYRTGRTADGLPAGEGTFIMCTLWLVDCLVLLGETDEATEMFERVLGVRNDLGLLSEQYDTDAQRLVGNFPQAFSHVALIAAADSLRSGGMAGSVQRGRRATRPARMTVQGTPMIHHRDERSVMSDRHPPP